MRKIGLIFVVLVTLILGAVPRVLNYQGKITGADGSGLNDTLMFEFKLFTVESGGEPIWSEIQDVVVKNGLFSVALGAVNPFPDTVDFSDEYWLEVKVEGETLSPRERLASAPYSIRSEYTTKAIQSIHTDLNPEGRRGRLLLRAGRGATLVDSGDSIIVRIEREEADSIPTLAQVLLAGNDAGDRRIRGLANPINNDDAATKAYVDAVCSSGGGGFSPQSLSQVLAVGNSAGGFSIDMNNNRIVNLGGPVELTDAATKGYVESLGGDGLVFYVGAYRVNVDETTIEIVDDMLKVKQGGIDSSHIKQDAITGWHILDHSIKSEDIGEGEIKSLNIEPGAVNSRELGSTGVVAGTYNNATITVDEDGRLTYAADGAVAGIGGEGSSGFIAKFVDVHIIENSIIYEQDGKIGIGTTTPTASLEINGGLRLNTETTRPICDSLTRGLFWYVKGETASPVDVCCYTPTEGTSCTATCPSGGIITEIVYVKYGASQCNNAPSCANPSQGADCANRPTYCVGQTSCTWTFNNSNCGDTCVGYNKPGSLTVRCTRTRDAIYVCMFNQQSGAYEWKLLRSSTD